MTGHYMQPLFRPEVIAHATRRLDGAVLLPAPFAAWGAVAFVVAVLALGAWFAATATYTRKESAPGWLSPQGGVARAVAGRRGTVTALLVSEGDIVEAGTPLAMIATDGDYVVTAPIRGRVEALAARVGQSVSRSSTVAVLAANDELMAELLVSPRARRVRRGGSGTAPQVRRAPVRAPRRTAGRRNPRLADRTCAG